MSHCQNLGELVILADGRQTMNRDLCGHGHFFMDDHSTSLFDHDIFIYIYINIHWLIYYIYLNWWRPIPVYTCICSKVNIHKQSYTYTYKYITYTYTYFKQYVYIFIYICKHRIHLYNFALDSLPRDSCWGQDRHLNLGTARDGLDGPEKLRAGYARSAGSGKPRKAAVTRRYAFSLTWV